MTLDGIASTASQAAGADGAQSGAYAVSGGLATLGSRVLAGIPGTISGALGPLESALGGLAGADGGLADPVAGLPVVGQVTSLLGLGPTTQATVGSDLIGAVTPLLGQLTSADGLVGDRVTGLISADLALLPGDPLAVVRMASASVGPNAGPPVVPPAPPAAPTAASLAPTGGPATGGTVTVTGTGFVPGATTVKVDAATVPAGGVTVASPTSLSFAMPAHAAGPAGISVGTAGGTSSALTYTFTAPVRPGHPAAAGGRADHPGAVPGERAERAAGSSRSPVPGFRPAPRP